MQTIGCPFIGIYFGEVTVSFRNQVGNVRELYNKNNEFLGEDMLYNFTVIPSIQGSPNSGVQIIAQNVDGSKMHVNDKCPVLASEP